MLSTRWRVTSVQARGVVELGFVEADSYEAAKLFGMNRFAKKRKYRRATINVERIPTQEGDSPCVASTVTTTST